MRNIPKRTLLQFFQLNYTLSIQTSSSNILKCFNMHLAWAEHEYSKTDPKVKPKEMRPACHRDILHSWDIDQLSTTLELLLGSKTDPKKQLAS